MLSDIMLTVRDFIFQLTCCRFTSTKRIYGKCTNASKEELYRSGSQVRGKKRNTSRRYAHHFQRTTIHFLLSSHWRKSHFFFSIGTDTSCSSVPVRCVARGTLGVAGLCSPMLRNRASGSSLCAPLALLFWLVEFPPQCGERPL